jgi:5'-phosphate synthase pdxT subunit
LQSLDLIDITVERNAYGRQIDSFVGQADSVLDNRPLEAVFIRAPKIKRVGAGVEVLARLSFRSTEIRNSQTTSAGNFAGEPVLVRQSNIIAATFHPELTDDSRLHRLIVDLAGQHQARVMTTAAEQSIATVSHGGRRRRSGLSSSEPRSGERI